MAEQLGEAVLTVKADTTQLEAGLQRTRQQAEQTSQATEQAFSRTGRELQTAANGMQYFVDAAGRARSATGQFLTLAEQQAAGLNKFGQAAATGPASSIRSIQALQEKLLGLRSAYESVQIGSKGFQQLQREIQRTEQELQQVDKTLGATFARKAGGFGSGLLGALGVGVGIGAGAAVGGFLKDSIQQAIELETITRKLSNTLGQQGAGSALNFTKGLSQDLGLNFKSLADSFSRFTAAATAANVPLQTQKDLFAAVSKAGQALGLSNDEINGSFLALQQVASKGTVAMEELRGQLGERLPIALAATAKGLGISQQELIKLVDSGKLTADQFFPALTKGLNDLTANAEGIETTAQKFAKFQNAVDNLAISFGDNLLPVVTKVVDKLAKAIEGFGVIQKARNLGFDVGNLTGASVQAAQAVGALDQVQKQYNLTETQARNIFGQAVQSSGGQRTLFGLQFTDQQFAKFLDELNTKAAAFRAKNKDTTAELQQQTAAAKALADAQKAADLAKAKDIDKQQSKRASDFELSNIQAKTDAIRQQTVLESQALSTGIQISKTKQLQLQQEQAIADAKRQQQDARDALRLEREKPVQLQDPKTIDGLLNKIDQANANVTQAYAAAGLSLVQNARQAADALKSAQKGFDSSLQSNFSLLTPEYQQQAIDAARKSVGAGVSAGIINPNTPIGTPEQLFRVAQASESLLGAQNQLQQAVAENAAATKALAGKDWAVNVSVSANGQSSVSGNVVSNINRGMG